MTTFFVQTLFTNGVQLPKRTKSVVFKNYCFSFNIVLCNMTTSSKKGKLITDLDQSDSQIPVRDKPLHSSRVIMGKKHLSNLCGNFPNRSRSAEWNPKKQQGSTDFETVLHDKDKQMESLVQRIGLLYKYNNQFAKENKKLLTLLKQTEANNSKECEVCSQLTAEKNSILEANSNLQNDVAMMKVLVYRLNVQIESYQDKLRNTNGSMLDDETPRSEFHERKNLDSCWGPVNSETLGPLLNSYEEMIKDKNDLIQQHEKELKHFTGELKKVIDENLQLQQECDVIKKSSNGWLETKTRLQSQLDSLKSKLDIQTKRADLAKEKLLEVIQCYEQKTQNQSLDLEHLQNAYSRCKNELVAIKSSTANQQNAIVESLKECKELFEELKSQHKNEKSSLESKIEELRKENTELLLKNEELKKQEAVLKNEFNSERCTFEELKAKTIALQKITDKLKKSRDRLKARLKIALEWAKKLEQEHSNFENNWEAVKRLETVVKHKEAQLRGLHARHVEEMDKMRQKLEQKEDTIKNILKSKINI
ncbi:protein Cep89 homolog [Episyrphus balteatus]|uniref:protein Cep89 homolog n=1 Tax=Episyrphus balteatus TaxID=286459 RepID=UPI0024862A0D|nr:protein Cep89 homolog [Episyrphus balteatus]